MSPTAHPSAAIVEEDHSALIAKLTDAIGAAYVLTDAADMAGRLVEDRGLYTGTAIAILRPGSTDEVATCVRLCAAAGVAIVPQGGNTGLVGGGVADGGVILTTDRMNRIRNVDATNATMTVDAGCILANIQQAADDAGALFPLSLASEGSCQIGGNLSTNAGGTAVLRYGNMRDLVLGLEVVLPDGRVLNDLNGLRKNNTGYDLRNLFIGAEGTLGIITAAVLKLFPKPVTRATALVACDGDRSPAPQHLLPATDRMRRWRSTPGCARRTPTRCPPLNMSNAWRCRWCWTTPTAAPTRWPRRTPPIA
nr:FAD-binding oxidoreductase [Pseudosulfitobacter pseudonitzschiae]